MPAITIARLIETDAAEAFGLARLAFGGLAQGRWRQMVRRWTRRPEGSQGALVGRDRGGRLVGFAPFAVRETLSEGRVLWVEGVIGFSLLDPAPIIAALTEGLAEVANAQGCRGMEVAIRREDRVLRAALACRHGRSDGALMHCPI